MFPSYRKWILTWTKWFKKMIQKNYMKRLYQMPARIYTDQPHTQHFFAFLKFFPYLHVITCIMKVKLKVSSFHFIIWNLQPNCVLIRTILFHLISAGTRITAAQFHTQIKKRLSLISATPQIEAAIINLTITQLPLN